MKHKELTRAEEQVMRILWALEKGFLKDIVEEFPEPKPAYTTVSTVVRVLVSKGFIGFKTFGKIHEYYPIVSKTQYFNSNIRPLISSYLNTSPSGFASYFSSANLNISELEEIRLLVEEKIKKLKSRKK
jgi:BlaI family transcriptional regulator, penicillinase repressor